VTGLETHPTKHIRRASANVDLNKLISRPKKTMSEPEAPEPSVVCQKMWEILKRVSQAENLTPGGELLTEYLQISVNDASIQDVVELINYAGLFAGNGERGEEIWRWAQRLDEQFGADPSVKNMVASLGQLLRSIPHPRMQSLVSLEELEQTFRATIAMDDSRAGNYQRAGDFFLSQEKIEDAEQCFRHSFSLDQTDSHSATMLSDIFASTDRLANSLAVLKACLKAGCDDSVVIWQAAMNATMLQEHDLVLEFLDQFEVQRPGQSWSNYYRALAHLQKNDFELAIQAIKAEQEHEYESDLHLRMVTTAAQLGSKQIEPALEELRNINQNGFGAITELTADGILILATCLSRHMEELPKNHLERQEFEKLHLESGMLADNYFEDLLAVNDVEHEDPPMRTLFKCVLRQKLDSNWKNTRGCLAHQKEWDHYTVEWGVFADSLERAVEIALDWQIRCVPDSESYCGIEITTVYPLDEPMPEHEGPAFCSERLHR
jgi:tetratricopeptide (TPR) repeat protein